MSSRRAASAPAAVVLAAGKGTRLPGTVPKALVECLGEPLLAHVRRALEPLAPCATVVVVGHGRDAVSAWLSASWPDAVTAVQQPQHGTGHATRIALGAIPSFRGDVLVVCGDVPQLAADDLGRLLAAHHASDAAASVLVGEIHDPGRLGRIVRDATGAVVRIVEAADATPAERALREFNTGVYVFDAAALRPALEHLPRTNRQGEEYLTDAVAALVAKGLRVEGVSTPNGTALLGVNTPADLVAATAHLRAREIARHLEAGVQIVDPASTVLEADVRIAAGARILPFTYVAHGCTIGPGAVVGPFAHLRGGTILEEGAQIGNFVEAKATTMGRGAKAKHLTYLGDATIGEGANIGCGTITANYDGKRKHRTVVGAGARIGSGTVLVAPVTVGAGAATGAGAVVTAGKDVPPGATVVGVPARPLGATAGSSPRPTKIPRRATGAAKAARDTRTGKRRRRASS